MLTLLPPHISSEEAEGILISGVPETIIEVGFAPIEVTHSITFKCIS